MAGKRKKNRSGKKKASISSAVVVQSAPAAKGTKAKAIVPKVSYRPDGSCMVAHTEFISDVYTGIVPMGAADTYRINPQSNTTFTWLSSIATRFELYRFHRLIFRYRPSCGTASNGWVIMGVDFDSYDNTPSKVEVLAWKMSSKAAVWQESHLDVSKETKMSTYRFCDSNGRGDLRFDDVAKLVILAASSDGIRNVGEIFVDYIVEFRQPSYKVPPALYADFDRRTMTGGSDWFGLTKDIFNAVRSTASNLNIEWVAPNVVKINDTGNLLVDVLAEAASGITGPIPITFTAPPGEPGASFQAETIDTYYVSTLAAYAATLVVTVAPVIVTLADYAGAGLKSRFKFSTFRR